MTDVRRSLLKGEPLDERSFNKFIGYSIGIILAYYVLGFFIQYLIYGVVGLVLFRIVQEYQKNKK